ncbi:MAG: alpha/beta fold hydrolase BchO [Pseudomonadota bacterium]
MDWARDRAIWPNAEASQFFDVKPHNWHVQTAGSGDTMLLLHGAGGATQSWRDLFPILARDFYVVAPDLPGQGFTRMGTRMRCGYRPIAEDLARLCEAQGWRPKWIVGHSAGAVLALELTRYLDPEQVVCINAALGKFEGIAGWLFPLMAKFMAINPLIPPLFARMAGGERRVAELLASTGSTINAEGHTLYRKLMTDKHHIDGTLAMMAQWNIDPLLNRLDQITVPVHLIVGDKDGTVPAETSVRAADKLPNATLTKLPGIGHLAHEEVPAEIAALIRQSAGDTAA